ncbi:MAG TPA: helix-hairpin-helix domain-containing protein [Thermoanaerobaculia bacterium]|nr:helix-hairpin-helix domain-containing protein [Thermoanaerobaculia bacterium]
MARAAKTTTDHDEIRRWVESRGGYPADVKRTAGDGDPGVLRIDYPGFSGQRSLERISWDQFFEWFDRNNLAFLYQDTARSRFSKLVDRGTVRARAAGNKKANKRSVRRASRSASRTKSARASHGTSSRSRTSARKSTRKPKSARTAASTRTRQPKTDRVLDINTASEVQLQRVFEIDGKRAKALASRRPFRSWDDVKRIPGFDRGLVENIQEAGGRLRSR